MIYTVTLNPAIDRELTVPTITFDTVLRATAQRVDCGGKGFNVSRMVAQLGGESVAVGLAGGRSGELLHDMLTAQGIATDFVWIDGETRTNTSIVEQGRYIKVNESGGVVSAEQQALLLEKVRGLARPNDWWVLAGSLPPNVPSNMYAQLIDILNAANARVFLDASGDALRYGCAAGPFLVKPNIDEAAQVTGLTDPSEAAQMIQEMGVTNVIVSLDAEGVLLREGEDVTRIPAPKIEAKNPIGAGDALVGGVVWGLDQGLSVEASVRWGVACGSVAASLSGTAFGDKETVEALLKRI